jgi:hypothetical protein
MLSVSAHSTVVSSVIALLVLSSGINARTLEYRLQCLSTDNSEIIALRSCGDKGSVAYCLGSLQPTSADALLQQVSTCYLNAGCEEAESEFEAARALAQCEAAKDTNVDLRKRQAAKATETEPAAATTVKPATSAKSGPKTTLVAGTTEQKTEKAAATEKTTHTDKAVTPTPTPATTTSAPSTTSTESTPSSTSTDSTPSTSPPRTTAVPGPGLAHVGRPPVCFTTSLHSTTSCPVQSTGSRAGQALSCFPTTVPTSVCGAGLICQQDDNGNATCMYAYSRFDTAGVIIAIFFAVAVTGAVALIATLCCREKRAHKRAAAAAIALEARRMAGKAGMGVSVAEVRDDREERAGLMGAGGAEPAAGYAGYTGGIQEAGPFGDQHRIR